MEDKRKSGSKDNQTKASEVGSTIKRWDNCWVQSEVSDSSGTTSTSEPGDDYSGDSHNSRYNGPPEHRNQAHGFCKSQGCLCQSCLLGLARVIALQGSLPNICTAANAASHNQLNAPFCNSSYSSIPVELVRQLSKELHCGGANYSAGHHACNCHASSQAHQLNQKLLSAAASGSAYGAAGKASASPGENNRCVGSLDRRKRRFKSKIDRDHRVKSQSDLTYYDKKNKPHYCSLQQFHCPNKHTFSVEERIQKLENDRSALHMEISVLSEQLDAQSGKIIELESALKEKKDALRRMEELLQKEVLLRSALETQKLELLSSLSEMKLKQASLEHENLALRSANSLTNSERFSRHAGHYSSLPRPPTSSKKGVVFASEEKSIIADNPNYATRSAPPKPFSQLTVEEIGDWLANLGLESYANELKRWGASGPKLLDAPHNQLEKELDIKNVMHRKKLLYAIESEKNNGAGFFGSDKMDNAAVLRWLDDVGLPQHKEAFYNGKVDGRVLHRLTTEDLLFLNVTAQLHAASLRRGIQVLRELNFDYDSLERRSNSGSPSGTPGEGQVALWTNHRVMEWLRVVDLAEYAPNMRGSGVHGGLMVYEHRFNAELLASLLSIPPTKTLLRRHLNTHFNQIVGREVVQLKRQMENTLGFSPLTLTARLKTPKRTQFTLKRKKSKNEIDFGNLVCPLDESPPGTPLTPATSPGSSNLNSPTF